ncbi:hypothetical protein ACFL03_04435 [Thermodesulfobacteriota bacterium]
MSKRSHLIESITETIADYRDGEIPAPTPEHVNKWVKQFETPVQIDILSEVDHILKQTYWSKDRVIEDLTDTLETKKLAGKNPASFWKSANFLNIQQLGSSQEDFLNLLNDILKKIYGFNINECGSPDGPYIYIDDCLFTGGHIIGDIKSWIEDNGVNDAELHIIVIGCHQLGEYFAEKDLIPVAKKKKVNVKLWRTETIENRKFNINQSQVLRPTTIPNEPHVIEYVKKLEELGRKPLLRKPMKATVAPFSSERRRQILEEAFLVAGAYIIDQCQKPAVSMRPLGYWNIHELGFGSLFITYRNCPNNCPLAFWWGDPDASPSHPFSKWYPLVPRKVNKSYEIGDFEFNWDI